MQTDLSSPDRRLLVLFQCNEVKMSHWICNPRVTFDGEVLLDLWPSATFDWDGDAELLPDSRLTLHLRRYPGSSPGLTIEIDAPARIWRLVSGTCPPDLLPLLSRALRELPAAQ